MIEGLMIGEVSKIDASEGTVRVFFPAYEYVSKDLPLLNFEYNMPKVGDQVACLFSKMGIYEGVCLGGFYSKVQQTPENDERIFKKLLKTTGSLKYDDKEQTLTICAKNVLLKGNIKITGDSEVETLRGKKITAPIINEV